MSSPLTTDTNQTIQRIRRVLLVLLFLGQAAVGAELLLLEHYEDTWQFVPLFVVALGLLSVAWIAVGGGRASVRALQVLMMFFMVAGGAGVVLHYRGNLEFQLEIDPSQSRWELFKKVLHAKAPPALAPGAMAQLGLLGLIYAYRHPALGTPDDSTVKGA